MADLFELGLFAHSSIQIFPFLFIPSLILFHLFLKLTFQRILLFSFTNYNLIQFIQIKIFINLIICDQFNFII
jgi:hypothetical protein